MVDQLLKTTMMSSACLFRFFPRQEPHSHGGSLAKNHPFWRAKHDVGQFLELLKLSWCHSNTFLCHKRGKNYYMPKEITILLHEFCYKDAKLLMKVGFSIGRYAMEYMCLAHAKKTMVVWTELHMWTQEEASCRHRLSTLAQRNRKKTETQRCCAAYICF